MKKTCSFLLALLILIMLPLVALAEDNITYTEGTLYYTVQGESITITGCFGHDAEVHVPAIIAGTPVNTIATGAFTENTYVQTLYLPDTVSKVERGAIGDWIKVIYNANTDHPQETPTELILRNQDSEPETASQEAETTKAEQPSAPETSSPEETAMETQTPPDAKEEETSEPAVTQMPSSEQETSASAVQTVFSEQETTPAAEAASSVPQTSPQQPAETPQETVSGHVPVEEYPPTSHNGFWLLIPLGAAAALGAVLLKKKKKK